MNQVLAYQFIAVMVALLAPACAVVWVLADAYSIRRLEIHTCGCSDCNPTKWALAVFLLPVVFIPLYVRFHRSRTLRLEQLTAAASLAD